MWKESRCVARWGVFYCTGREFRPGLHERAIFLFLSMASRVSCSLHSWRTGLRIRAVIRKRAYYGTCLEERMMSAIQRHWLTSCPEFLHKHVESQCQKKSGGKIRKLFFLAIAY